ncbi:hypothetical protein F0562_014870 [Nyssa sinensis]|uniref:Uncharacterized protein n=1 Tax=Nyssa sinensis TaxID=561372 RepID=A0A5J4ZS07_9ASTE|nr:hypothetical protein F0562_014870 [Nyssa sinensis]
MKKLACSRTVSLLIFFLLLVAIFSIAEAQSCKPSGKLKGKKPPPGACNTENNSECCEPGKLYDIYKCSPKVTGHTNAVLTINSFEEGGDGGGPSECDNKYHSDDTPVVSLSTGWFNKKKRCLNFITIHGNGKSVKAMVVDECDSTMGCDADHDYQPPCDNNIVDASKAVWKALGVPEKDWGGKLKGKKPPPRACNTENNSDCCEAGKFYDVYKCSPKVTGHTKAVLTINSFEKDGDGGGPSECDNKYHSDDTPVVALSTGWFNKKRRCLNFITIHGNGKSVKAKVVDECDSTMGCDAAHDYQPPCDNNIVDASKAVWKALGVPEKDWVLTINSFEEGGDGGGSSKCDNKFHSDNTSVVTLSTGWFNKKKRCLNFIHGNGKSVKAKVVDECDSTMGSDKDHDFQPPCDNNIVDASKAVWKAIGVPEREWGELDIFWSDA